MLTKARPASQIPYDDEEDHTLGHSQSSVSHLVSKPLSFFSWVNKGSSGRKHIPAEKYTPVSTFPPSGTTLSSPVADVGRYRMTSLSVATSSGSFWTTCSFRTYSSSCSPGYVASTSCCKRRHRCGLRKTRSTKLVMVLLVVSLPPPTKKLIGSARRGVRRRSRMTVCYR